MQQNTARLIATLVLAITLLVSTVHSEESAAEEKIAEPFGTLITVAEKTTVFTQPLRSDCYVDYVAAVNQMRSDDVDAEDNAALLVLEAWGPKCLDLVDAERFYKIAQIEPLSPKGEYFVTIGEFAEGRIERQERRNKPDLKPARVRRRIRKAYEQARSRPWSEDEFPQVTQWLRDNQRPLELVRRSCERSRYFVPALPSKSHGDKSGLYSCVATVGWGTRPLAVALTTRSMLHLKRGQTIQAWEDALTCHRLGRLTGQDASFSGHTSCIAAQGIVSQTTPFFITSDALTAEQARAMIADLQSLPPLPRIAERFDSWERWWLLDLMAAYASGREPIYEMEQLPSTQVAGRILTKAGARIDWDLVLRRTNAIYDRIVEALSQPTYAEQSAAIQVLQDEADAFQKACANSDLLSDGPIGEAVTTQWLSNQFCDAVTCLFQGPLSARHEADTRAASEARLNLIGFALAAYRIEHGAYPKQLGQLVPEYLPELPADPCTETLFRYQPNKNGFLLYSIGLNQKDDGGRNYYLDRDVEHDDEPDDYRLQVPPP